MATTFQYKKLWIFLRFFLWLENTVLLTMCFSNLDSSYIEKFSKCKCWWPQGILFPFPLSSRCGFLECRPLAGEYPAKRLCVVRPALGAYISGTRLVRGTYSLAGCSCTSYSPPSRGMGFHKLSIVFYKAFYHFVLCSINIAISPYYVIIPTSAKWTVFTLIVFTQVNSRPTMLFYSLVFLLFIGSEPMGILQPSILIPFIDDWVYRHGGIMLPR